MHLLLGWLKPYYCWLKPYYSNAPKNSKTRKNLKASYIALCKPDPNDFKWKNLLTSTKVIALILMVANLSLTLVPLIFCFYIGQT